jgi:tryptophanyl-tRNA synthetase
MRILSGIQSSGGLHIGNYFGMIKPMVESQNRGELFCFLADMHSMTSVSDGAQLRRNTQEAIIDLLALGIDPAVSTFWVQSDVPEVAELTWYLSNVTPLGLLERCHSYKDKVAKSIPANAGLFTYPVLMAADILLYQTDIVPVGRDQKQHVEVTRDIAMKFNQAYGEVFTVPEAQIKDDVAVIPGIDGQKMSKSYGNSVEIFLDEKTLKKKIMSIVTDSTPVEAPKDPQKSVIYALYRLMVSGEDAAGMEERFRRAGMGYGDAKKELFGALRDFFAPFRRRREELEKNLDYVAQVRRDGALKARRAGSKTLEKVRRAIGAGA